MMCTHVRVSVLYRIMRLIGLIAMREWVQIALIAWSALSNEKILDPPLLMVFLLFFRVFRPSREYLTLILYILVSHGQLAVRFPMKQGNLTWCKTIGNGPYELDLLGPGFEHPNF